MLNKEMLLGITKEKPLSLTITNIGAPGDLMIKIIPRNKTETVYDFPIIYSKSMLEGQTKIELSCSTLRAIDNYYISGQGVSIDYFDRGGTMIRFNLSPNGVNAIITLDLGIGSG